MNKNFIWLLGLLNIIFFKVSAQQIFFNVVSSDITPKKKNFFQQQINITNNELQSNTTVSTGLGHNFEVGLNYFGLNANRFGTIKIEQQNKNAPYIHYLMINAQKRIDINTKMAVAIGFQQGITIDKNNYFGGNYYANYILKNEEISIKFVTGLYYATNSYFGEGSRLLGTNIGVQMGVEKVLSKGNGTFKVILSAANIVWATSLSVLHFFLSKKWVISSGYQLPTFNSSSQKALVVELTYIPINTQN